MTKINPSIKFIMKTNLLIILIFTGIVASPIVSARDECLRIKNALESNKPAGELANTAWDIYEAKDSYADWSKSELVFSEEKIRKSKISVTGYFFWFADGESFGCEKISGIYKKETGVLMMKTVQVSTSHLSASTFYKATLSPDGQILSGSWSGENTATGKWKARRLNPSDNEH